MHDELLMFEYDELLMFEYDVIWWIVDV